MENVLYSEWVPAGKFLKTIVGFAFLLYLFILAITIWVSVSIRNPSLAAVVAIPTAFLLILCGNYRGIQIRITSNELIIRYGLLNRKHIHMANIVSCEPTKANFGKYWGVGIRYGTDGSWAYSTSFGNAVKIVQLKGRPFVFSSNKPDEICSTISRMKHPTKV
jgi:hypothetical protein